MGSRWLVVVALLASCGDRRGAPDAGVARDAAGRADSAIDAALIDAAPADAASRLDLADEDAAPSPIDPTCRANGCLRSATAFGAYGRDEIEALIPRDVAIDNGYSVWRIVFFTDGREARASVTFPHPNEPPREGYSIGVITPGTVGLADACAVGNDVAGTGLAAFFGAYAMVGVALDYPGLGTDGLHPYLVRTVEARAALDGVRAVLDLARREHVRVSGRAVVAGLSQGGHAAIAAAAEHASYAPELDLRAFAAAAPANVFLEQWAGGVALSGAHIVYHALLVHAWSVHYAHEGRPLFAAPIDVEIANWMSSLCTYAIAGRSLYDVIPTDPAAVFDPAFLAAYRSATLDEYPAIARGFRENRLTPYTQTAPLLVYQGTDDDVVLPFMTDALVASLREGDVEIDYRVVDGGAHDDIAFSFVAVPQSRAVEARAWLTEHLAR